MVSPRQISPNPKIVLPTSPTARACLPNQFEAFDSTFLSWSTGRIECPKMTPFGAKNTCGPTPQVNFFNLQPTPTHIPPTLILSRPTPLVVVSNHILVNPPIPCRHGCGHFSKAKLTPREAHARVKRKTVLGGWQATPHHSNLSDGGWEPPRTVSFGAA